MAFRNETVDDILKPEGKSVDGMSKEERRVLIGKLKNNNCNDVNAKIILQKLQDNPQLEGDIEIFLIKQVLKIQQTQKKDPNQELMEKYTTTYPGLKFSFSLNGKLYSTEEQPRAESEKTRNCKF